MTKEELQAIGQQLRAVRLERDHTLEAVSAATRIRVKFLEAIEAGEPDPTLSDMQLRGFLRNYAAFLHLDLDAMLAAYQQALEKRSASRFGLFKGEKDEPPPAVPIIPLYGSDPVKTPPGAIPRVARPASGTGEFVPPETRSRFALFLMTIITLSLVGIALAAGIIAVSQLSSNTSEPSSEPPPLQVESENSEPTEAATEEMMSEPGTLTPSSTPTASGVIVNTPSMIGANQIAISLEATQRSWVRLVVDGEVEYEGLLRPGTALQYQGQQSITLRTSNAGGLAVVVNNQPLGSLGERGEGYEQTFTLDTLPLVTQAPVTAEPSPTPPPNFPTLPPPPPPLVTEEVSP